MARIYESRPGGSRGEAREGKGLPPPSAPVQAKKAGADDPGGDVDRAARFGHDLSRFRIGPGRPREDRSRSLPCHRPGCGCPSCAGRRGDGAEAPVAAPAAEDSEHSKVYQLCSICGNPFCTDPSRHATTVDAVMADVDPRSEVRFAMETADARYRHQAASATAGPHLFGSAEVRGVDRRSAEVREPADRLVLSAEPRVGPRDPHYTQLRQSAGAAAAPLVVGRFQDPTSRNAAPRERHIYEQGARGAPSYPREASHMSGMAAADPRSPFAALESAMLARPFAASVPDEATQRHLMTTASIIGIAEQRRDPFMGMASAQTIVHGARADEPPSPSEVFGERRGRVNRPGLLPASGTGAVAAFREFRSDLEADAPPSTPSSVRLRENIEEQHSGLMRMGIDQENLDRMAARGDSEESIRQAALLRARSAATRQAAMMTGQVRYGLRSLLPPAERGDADEED
jgi:hypothetical protein